MPDPEKGHVAFALEFVSPPEARSECRDYESVIRAEELRTPMDTTVLLVPQSSTDRNVVNLIFHLACIGIPKQPE